MKKGVTSKVKVGKSHLWWGDKTSGCVIEIRKFICCGERGEKETRT